MPTTAENIKTQTELRKSAASTRYQGAGMEATATTLHDTLMEAIRGDRAKRGVSKLATDVGNVMGQMTTGPGAMKERAGDIVDPTSIDYLTSQARAQDLRTLGTVATQGELNQGSIDEVIQAGANQFTSRAQRLYGEAAKEEAEANTLQQQITQSLAQRKQEFSERMQEEQLKLAKMKISTAGKAGTDKELKEKLKLENAKKERLDYASRLSGWSDAAEKLGVINESNIEEFQDNCSGLAEEVAAGDLSAVDAVQLLHRNYWPVGGIEMTKSEDKGTSVLLQKVTDWFKSKKKETPSSW